MFNVPRFRFSFIVHYFASIFVPCYFSLQPTRFILRQVDGKHVHVRAPDNTGSMYFNYKKSFSINLMAIADADYKFLMVDIGQMGSVSDGGVWESTVFGHAWKNG